MVHPWAILHSPVRRQEWWRKITYFSPQILQTYRVEMPIFLIPSYTHQFCSVMIKLFSYSIFFVRQLILHGEVTGSPINRTEHHRDYRQRRSYHDSSVAKSHCISYLIIWASIQTKLKCLFIRLWGMDILILYGLHALSSTDFVTDSAASYTTSYTGIRQNFFSCKNTLIVSHRKWYKEGQDFVSKRTQLFLIKNPYNTLPWN